MSVPGYNPHGYAENSISADNATQYVCPPVYVSVSGGEIERERSVPRYKTKPCRARLIAADKSVGILSAPSAAIGISKS